MYIHTQFACRRCVYLVFSISVLFTQLSAAIFLTPPHRLNQVSISIRFLDAIFSEADILHDENSIIRLN